MLVKIPMYGLPRELTTVREVEVELPEGAGMAEVVTAMKTALPELEGAVIRTGTSRLEDNYKFNLNGHFYYAGMEFSLKPGDRIALLVPVTGG